MPLHLIKLCVGCDSIEDLATWQAERLKVRRRAGEKKPRLFHRTFQTPKRRAELLDGGSLYWVIKGLVQVRQPLLDIAEGSKAGGISTQARHRPTSSKAWRTTSSPCPRSSGSNWRSWDCFSRALARRGSI